MAFVYFLEQNPRYYPAARTIFRQVKEGSLQAHASSLVFAEVLVHPYRTGKPELAAATFATLHTYDNLEWVDLSPPTAREAARLRAIYGLRTPDAVHVATALSVKADWIITNDKGLRRVEPEGVRVWLFDEATE